MVAPMPPQHQGRPISARAVELATQPNQAIGVFPLFVFSAEGFEVTEATQMRCIDDTPQIR